jgi:hypothetical protein
MTERCTYYLNSRTVAKSRGQQKEDWAIAKIGIPIIPKVVGLSEMLALS